MQVARRGGSEFVADRRKSLKERLKTKQWPQNRYQRSTEAFLPHLRGKFFIKTSSIRLLRHCTINSCQENVRIILICFCTLTKRQVCSLVAGGICAVVHDSFWVKSLHLIKYQVSHWYSGMSETMKTKLLA